MAKIPLHHQFKEIQSTIYYVPDINQSYSSKTLTLIDRSVINNLNQINNNKRKKKIEISGDNI